MDTNSNQAKGNRKLDRGFYRSKLESKKWQGLPPGVQRGQLMQVLRRIGPEVNVSAELIQRLDTLVSITKDQDWNHDSRPIVSPKNDWLMKEWGLSKSQVQRTLNSLQDLGLIVAHDSPSGRRYWKRDEDGRLIVAYGFDLSPLAIRYDELLQKLERREAEFEARKALKRDFTIIRREIFSLFIAVEEGRLPYCDLKASQAAYEAFVDRYDPNAPLPHMEDYLADFRAFQEVLEKKIETIILEEQELEAKEAAKNCNNSLILNDNNPYGRTDATVILNTNHPSNSKSCKDDSQEEVVSLGDRASSGSNGVSEKEKSPLLAALDRLPGVIEKNNNLKPNAKVQQPVQQTTTGVEKLTPKMIMSASKVTFSQWVENPNNPTWDAIIFAGQMTAKSMRLSDTDWRYASHKIGPHAASVALMVLASRASDVNNVGGYLKGMLKKAEAGDLHLHKSVFGILAKNAQSQSTTTPALL